MPFLCSDLGGDIAKDHGLVPERLWKEQAGEIVGVFAKLQEMMVWLAGKLRDVKLTSDATIKYAKYDWDFGYSFAK